MRRLIVACALLCVLAVAVHAAYPEDATPAVGWWLTPTSVEAVTGGDWYITWDAMEGSGWTYVVFRVSDIGTINAKGVTAKTHYTDRMVNPGQIPQYTVYAIHQ